MTFARSILIAAIVAATPFQDTILVATPLRQMGRSFAILPLLLLLLLDLAAWLALRPKVLNLKFVAAICYICLLTTAYLGVFGVAWNDVSLPLKAANMIIVSAIAVYAVAGVDWTASPYLPAAVKTAFVVTVAGILLCDLDFLGLGSVANSAVFHQTTNPDLRWRGFNSEASALSLTLATLGILSAALSVRRWAQVAFFAITGFLLAAGGSKGGILSLALVVALSLFTVRGHFGRLCGYLLLAAPIAYLAADRFLSLSTLELLSETATLATRGTLALWASLVVLHNPLGVGFGGFYPALSEYLPDAIRTASQVAPIPLNFEEVVLYLTSSENASAKTMLMNFAVYLGVPFLLGYFVFVSRIVRACIRSSHFTLMAAILFVTVALCTYSDSLVSYNVLLVYGLGWREYTSNGHSARS